MTKTNELEQFLGCYFHQDWFEEFGNPQEAVNAYIINEPIKSKQELVRELSYLLKENDSLDFSFIGGLGCCYNPSSDNLTVHSWLGYLHKELIRNQQSQSR